ncbi:MAG: HAMP domain-containing histidine kinase [Ruminococcaceae bacterium]|nr:HAMP domain-containing histidine kinase [Oscillospiraceae bacterium]
MKLSWKFFFIAYIMVLLSTGLGGFFLVKSTTDTLWDEGVQRCKASHAYAVNSFYSLSDVLTLGESDYVLLSSAMESQIARSLDSSVSEFDILPLSYDKSGRYNNLEYDDTMMVFIEDGESCVLEIGSKAQVKENVYIIRCESDFSSLVKSNEKIWTQYRITVLLVAVLCGGLLFVFAKKLTKPLSKMSDTAKEIARGNYGLCIEVNGGGEEIRTLSENFNTMSTVVADSLQAIQKECDRRDTFVADFTHEIKTPVTSIIGYADMLSTYDLSDEEHMAAAQAVYREGKRLEKLSMQLLELIVTSKESPAFDCVSLESVEKSVRDVMLFSEEKYGVSLLVDLGKEYVFASSPMLLSLIYNLVDNAFKASPVNSQVRLYSENLGDKIKITVSDKGHGIGKEHIEHITEPFYREDKSRSRKGGGAGIGLALCKEICRLHETELFVESEAHKGTSVSFMLRKYTEEAAKDE